MVFCLSLSILIFPQPQKEPQQNDLKKSFCCSSFTYYLFTISSFLKIEPADFEVIGNSEYGKIYLTDKAVKPRPPLQPNCRCKIELMKAVEAGTLTPYGTAGADWFVKYLEQLPDYYLTKYDAEELKYPLA